VQRVDGQLKCGDGFQQRVGEDEKCGDVLQRCQRLSNV
jgi:hypothetical protein